MASRVGPHVRRAQQLLVAGLAGAHLLGLVAVVGLWVGRGSAGLVSALLAAAVTICFFTIGQAVQIRVAEAPAKLVLFASLSSYAIRVSLLGVVLILALQRRTEWTWLDPVAVVVTTIAVVIGWIGGEIRAHSRFRIPVYDSTEAESIDTGDERGSHG